MKNYLTKEQAISVLPEKDLIHTFINGVILIGADWEREDVIDKFEKSDIIELTGKNARNMGHGICVYNNDSKFLADVVFIETDEEKLKALEKELEGE